MVVVLASNKLTTSTANIAQDLLQTTHPLFYLNPFLSDS